MKRLRAFALSFICVLALIGCNKETEKLGIVVDGVFYEKSQQPMPADIDESAIIGYVRSYTKSIPSGNGETNISEKLIGAPFARVEGGIAVLYQHEWYLCKGEPAETELQIQPTVAHTLDCHMLQKACAEGFIDPSKVTVLGGEWAYTADPNKFVALATVRYTDKDDEYETADFLMLGVFGGEIELYHCLNEHSPYTRENGLQEFGAVNSQRFPLG